MALEHRFLKLLELPTSAAASKIFLSLRIQDKLCPGGDIHGVVRPDIPEVHPLFKFGWPRLTIGQKNGRSKRETVSGISLSVSDLKSIEEMESKVQQSGCWRVQTVAAQFRSRKVIGRRLVTSARSVYNPECGGSLLLVSGGHPLRKFPLVEPLLSGNSLEMLQTASQLRKSGNIPHGVHIWAVENPLVNSVERLEQKIHAGAETLILQPPLLLDRFGQWWDAARTRGLLQAARVVVGLPFITSVKNHAFWFELTGTSGIQVDSKLAYLNKIEAEYEGDKNGLAAYYKQETRLLIDYIKSLPDVGGIHFMPVTPSGWRQFARLQEEEQVL